MAPECNPRLQDPFVEFGDVLRHRPRVPQEPEDVREPIKNEVPPRVARDDETFDPGGT